MSHPNDISGPVNLAVAGLLLLLLRFLPQPWMQFHSFGVVAILGSTVLLLGLLRLRKGIEDPGEKRWLFLAMAGTLVLLFTALWEIGRPRSAPDVLWLRGLLWAVACLTLPCVTLLLGDLCRRRGFDQAETQWHGVQAWSLWGLIPSLLGTAMITPYGSYVALQGESPILYQRVYFGIIVNFSNLSSWLEDLTWTEQAAFWTWSGFSAATGLVTIWLLWKTIQAFRMTWRFLDDPDSAEAKIAWETSPQGRLSQAALMLFWAALLQAVSYSGVIFGLWISLAFFGKLLGVLALLRLHPLAADVDLNRAWTFSWAGLWILLAADVLSFRPGELSSVWNVVVLGGTLLGLVALPTFSRLMRDLCRKQDLGDVTARWDRVRRLALYGILPLVSIHFVSSLIVWATTSDVWISGWGLLGLGPGYWPLAFSWEILKIVLWVVMAWTWFRFLYAASGVLRSYRKADDSDATPSTNPLFSTP